MAWEHFAPIYQEEQDAFQYRICMGAQQIIHNFSLQDKFTENLWLIFLKFKKPYFLPMFGVRNIFFMNSSPQAQRNRGF